ncbi:MAG: hypothetical protein GEU79_07530 [Acidimicrobiia bacterium]|nr:hypothetical protein [Acidimicrobiia bacterium]
MARFRRFEEHRFIGIRDEMKVYDSDDPADSEVLERLLEDGELLRTNGIQTFGPDTLPEARNRGFRKA